MKSQLMDRQFTGIGWGLAQPGRVRILQAGNRLQRDDMTLA